MVDLLEARCSEQADAPAQTFLLDGDDEEERRTYGEVGRRARIIAGHLQRLIPPGGRAVLVYEPGLGFVDAFLGCMFAGVVAVPAYPPDPLRLERTLPRLQAIVADAGADMLLTSTLIASARDVVTGMSPSLGELEWLATDVLDGDEESWSRPDIDLQTLAFVQYSSGSTRAPRGVRITHHNLLANVRMIEDAFELVERECAVFWLPTYHDMGLVGGVLVPLMAGSHSVLMSPLDFLKKPARWLRAISRYGATVSGGPDFAYDMCVRKVPPEERATLDLSSWSLAFTGAEPIRPRTMRRFADAYAANGFRPEAFYPCYGLAEATLMVSGKVRSRPPRVVEVDAAALEEGRVVRSTTTGRVGSLVSCGPPVRDVSVRIAGPDSQACLPPGQVGEIQVSGPNLSAGYWDRTAASVSSTGGRRWLATGDLGFIDDGELVITGRIKELLIINGRNIYPQDVEAACGEADARVRPGNAAAFVVQDRHGVEGLVVCQEVDDAGTEDMGSVCAAIRRAVAGEFGVAPVGIALLRPRTLPKTSSGKIQRVACRTSWLEGSLDGSVVDRWLDDARLDAPTGTVS